MNKQIIIGALLLILGGGAAFGYLSMNKSEPAQTKLESQQQISEMEQQDEPFCNEHQIAEADCPWCNSSLIESKGECAEHGVPEALCVRCLPSLEAGFKVESDWCVEHSTPESQCSICLETGTGNDGKS